MPQRRYESILFPNYFIIVSSNLVSLLFLHPCMPFYIFKILILYVCPGAHDKGVLEDHHAAYTRCIGRMHSLATTSGPACKVGVV